MAREVRRYMHLRGLAVADAAALRTAEFHGREHLVVPVVLMVGDSVVWPVNADTPEFVPAAVLARAPAGWNGRPVLPNHPDGGASSANTPRTLERLSFGALFDVRFHEARLKGDAWLDIARAEELGGDPQSVVERVQAGEEVEVSVGAWVVGEERHGVGPNGQAYGFVWGEVVPDHLAMLPDGTIGACSVDMGCGAPRLNRAANPTRGGMAVAQLRAADDNTNSNPNVEVNVEVNEVKNQQTFLQRVASALTRFRINQEDVDEGLSDLDIRNALWSALRDTEPAFEGVAEVFQESGTVIYYASPSGEFTWFRRSFTLDDEGEVSLADDREEVEPITRFEPVSMEGQEGTGDDGDDGDVTGLSDTGCTCHQTRGKDSKSEGRQSKLQSKHEQEQGDDNTPDNAQEATEMKVSKKIEELVGRLISHARSPFQEGDEETLYAFSEERLTAMEEGFEADGGGGDTDEGKSTSTASATGDEDEGESTRKADKADSDDTGDGAGVEAKSDREPTEEEWLAAAPQSLRSILERAQREDEERRESLVSAIAKKCNGAYTEKQLNAKPTEELVALSTALSLDKPRADYSGQGLPLDRSKPSGDRVVPPPPSLRDRILARRGQSTGTGEGKSATN